jgi:hypothetical protein
LFSKAFSFSSVSLVDFQLSQLFVSTGNIHELNRLSFVLLLSGFDLQTFVSCLKALETRAIRILISDVTSPSLTYNNWHPSIPKNYDNILKDEAIYSFFSAWADNFWT